MKFPLPVEHPRVEAVSAIWDEAPSPARGSVFLLAPGSGSAMDHPWLAAIAAGLVARGFGVLRFDYGYRERARREGRRLPPDPRPRLEAVHARALAELARRAGGRRLILAGKSMGGRIGSHLAAFGETCHGLCLFGYPLHPPRRPDRRRDEHFAALVQPALFLQGSRDALGPPELLRASLARYGGHATLHVEGGADHGFHVPKRSGRTDEEVRRSLVERVDRWERETFPD